IIVANKMDMPEAEEHLAAFKKALGHSDIPIYPISTLTRTGLDDLLYAIADQLDAIPQIEEYFEQTEETVVYRHHEEEKAFQITRDPIKLSYYMEKKLKSYLK